MMLMQPGTDSTKLFISLCAGPYLEFFCWGAIKGAARVVKASTKGAKPGGLGGLPPKILKG
jgi:hypothetical protein